MRNPKVPSHETLGALHLSLYEKVFSTKTQRQNLVTCGTQVPQKHSPVSANLTLSSLLTKGRHTSGDKSIRLVPERKPPEEFT